MAQAYPSSVFRFFFFAMHSSGMIRELTCLSAVLLIITGSLSGCSYFSSMTVTDAEGGWTMVMACDMTMQYDVQYGWQLPDGQDLSKFKETAKTKLKEGFKFFSSAAASIAGRMANKVLELMGADFSSDVASESQTFNVSGRSGEYIWQWQWRFKLSGTDDAELKTRQSMVTDRNEAPHCIPGQFQDLNQPFGACSDQ